MRPETPLQQPPAEHHAQGPARRRGPSLAEFLPQPLQRCGTHGQTGVASNIRPSSQTGYITQKDMPAVRHQEIHAERDRREKPVRLLISLLTSEMRDVDYPR